MGFMERLGRKPQEQPKVADIDSENQSGITRRDVLRGGVAIAATAALPVEASAETAHEYLDRMQARMNRYRELLGSFNVLFLGFQSIAMKKSPDDPMRKAYDALDADWKRVRKFDEKRLVDVDMYIEDLLALAQGLEAYVSLGVASTDVPNNSKAEFEEHLRQLVANIKSLKESK